MWDKIRMAVEHTKEVTSDLDKTEFGSAVASIRSGFDAIDEAMTCECPVRGLGGLGGSRT
jgi:hypothetical protein